VVGIKLRAGLSGGAKDFLPYEKARQVADELEFPIMMHLSLAPPDTKTALSFLKPGDIVTHCYTGHTMKMIDDNGKILPEAKKAWEEGMIMDIAHGSGSLSFDSAEALISQGYYPHTVSTDLHNLSIHGTNLMNPTEGVVKGDGKPAFDLLTCMDKMLCVGMPFPEIIKATTSRPAEVLGSKGEIGTLKPGAHADIAGLVIDKGDYKLVDVHGQIRQSKDHIRNTFTILNGRLLNRIEVPKPPPWIELVK
ncbi:MAG: amidohydrolase/deacetylase family metallohydrolase, partial [Spirochaetota bacterium]